jgi:hypothetical protein
MLICERFKIYKSVTIKNIEKFVKLNKQIINRVNLNKIDTSNIIQS